MMNQQIETDKKARKNYAEYFAYSDFHSNDNCSTINLMYGIE